MIRHKLQRVTRFFTDKYILNSLSYNRQPLNSSLASGDSVCRLLRDTGQHFESSIRGNNLRQSMDAANT